MLDRLVAGDGAAEGEPLEGVVLGHLQGAVGAAGLLEGQEDGGPVQDLLDQGQALAGTAQALGRDLVEDQPGRVAGRIQGRERLAGHPGGRQVDEEEPQLATLPRQDQGMGGDTAVGNRDLGPRKAPALDGGTDRGAGEGARPFRSRQGTDDLAGGDPGQDSSLLGLGPGQHDRLSQHIDGGGEGDGGHGPAQFLCDDAELKPAQAQPAVFLRNGRAQPALSGHGLPEIWVPGRRGIVEDLAHPARGAVGLEEAPRLVLEKLLVLGEIEIHGLARLPAPVRHPVGKDHSLRPRTAED